MGLCAFGLCRDIHTCTALLFAPQEVPTGAGKSHPHGPLCWGNLGTQAHLFLIILTI